MIATEAVEGLSMSPPRETTVDVDQTRFKPQFVIYLVGAAITLASVIYGMQADARVAQANAQVEQVKLLSEIVQLRTEVRGLSNSGAEQVKTLSLSLESMSKAIDALRAQQQLHNAQISDLQRRLPTAR